jgi:hypothetical protein
MSLVSSLPAIMLIAASFSTLARAQQSPGGAYRLVLSEHQLSAGRYRTI